MQSTPISEAENLPRLLAQPFRIHIINMVILIID